MRRRHTMTFNAAEAKSALRTLAKDSGVDIPAEASIVARSWGEFSPGGPGIEITLTWDAEPTETEAGTGEAPGTLTPDRASPRRAPATQGAG